LVTRRQLFLHDLRTHFEDPMTPNIPARHPHRLIAGRAAVAEATVDKGRVVLLGFRVQHRGQPHATFKFLINGICLASSERPPADC
jgi:hypothetical protein